VKKLQGAVRPAALEGCNKVFGPVESRHGKFLYKSGKRRVVL